MLAYFLKTFYKVKFCKFKGKVGNLSFAVFLFILFCTAKFVSYLQNSSRLKSGDIKQNFCSNHEISIRVVENIVKIGENADNQHFLIFPHCFQLLSLPKDC